MRGRHGSQAMKNTSGKWQGVLDFAEDLGLTKHKFGKRKISRGSLQSSLTESRAASKNKSNKGGVGDWSKITSGLQIQS